MLELRKLRTEKGLSLKQLGDILGVSESTVSLYENGRRQPDNIMINKIADYFHCSTDYLLGRHNSDAISVEDNIDQLQKLLVSNYKKLNTQGQEKLLDYSDDLIVSGKYNHESSKIINSEKRILSTIAARSNSNEKITQEYIKDLSKSEPNYDESL